MRTVRLGTRFDCVFVHDAVVYMTTETDLRKAIETAHIHCMPGGAALFAPPFEPPDFLPADFLAPPFFEAPFFAPPFFEDFFEPFFDAIGSLLFKRRWGRRDLNSEVTGVCNV